jgi:hypothetical protein
LGKVDQECPFLLPGHALFVVVEGLEGVNRAENALRDRNKDGELNGGVITGYSSQRGETGSVSYALQGNLNGVNFSVTATSSNVLTRVFGRALENLSGANILTTWNTGFSTSDRALFVKVEGEDA